MNPRPPRPERGALPTALCPEKNCRGSYQLLRRVVVGDERIELPLAESESAALPLCESPLDRCLWVRVPPTLTIIPTLASFVNTFFQVFFILLQLGIYNQNILTFNMFHIQIIPFMLIFFFFVFQLYAHRNCWFSQSQPLLFLQKNDIRERTLDVVFSSFENRLLSIFQNTQTAALQKAHVLYLLRSISPHSHSRATVH